MNVDDGLVIDLFAGPGGWDVGAQTIGLHPVGLEIDAAAVATRYAAGHATWQQSVPDVTDTQLAVLRGHVDGLIASPPCQDFSAAGKKAGIGGDKGELMWQVPRWAKALRPRWICCEQVPPAEAWFRLFAHDLRADGYSTWVGILCAADYGVPQTRRRVFLIASLDRAVQPPEPTHCEGGSEASMFTPGLLPWVSMADALGWEDDLELHHPRGAGMVERHGERNGKPTSGPAGVMTSKGRSWELRPGITDSQPNRRSYDLTEPAPTVAFGHDSGNWVWAAVGDDCPGCGCSWDLHDAGGFCAGRCGGNVCTDAGKRVALRSGQSIAGEGRAERSVDEPAVTMTGRADLCSWVHERPATTIVGSFSPDTVAAPGYRRPGDPPRQDTPGSVKITTTEAAILQGFPPDYPWQGSRSKQFEQIGNAVCPPVAKAILRTLL